jgi:hypothetical protein
LSHGILFKNSCGFHEGKARKIRLTNGKDTGYRNGT